MPKQAKGPAMTRIQIYASAAVVTMAGMLGVFAWLITSAPKDPFDRCRQSVVAGGVGSIGGPFTLISETGETVTDADVFSKPTLVYFGYTFCPDVCPMDTARNADAVDVAKTLGYDVGSAMISIDPERDTPEVMAEYTDYMHPDMIGLTGSPEQVKAASQAYRTYYQKQPSEDEFYLVDHSTFTYLVLPEHGVVEYFRREVEPDAMAKTTACFIDRAS